MSNGARKEKADAPLEGESVPEGPDVAEIYKQLLKGEQAATALEGNLTNLESKLDAILNALGANSLPPEDVDESTQAAGTEATEVRKPLDGEKKKE